MHLQHAKHFISQERQHVTVNSLSENGLQLKYRVKLKSAITEVLYEDFKRCCSYSNTTTVTYCHIVHT